MHSSTRSWAHLQIPLWLGVLMTPALGLLFAAGRYVVKLVRRRTASTTTAPMAQPFRAITVPTLARAQALPEWVAATPRAVCRRARPVAVTAWSTAPVATRARTALR